MASGLWQRLSEAWHGASMQQGYSAQDLPVAGSWPLADSSAAAAQAGLLDNEQLMIQVQVLAYDLAQALHQELASQGAVHWPTLLAAAGALAGYSCQASVATLARQHGLAAEQALRVQQLGDGRRYSRAASVDRLLLEDHPSLWSVLSAAARQQGVRAEQLPNIGQLYSYVGATVGTSSFGVMRIEPVWLPLQPLHCWPERLWPQCHIRLQQSGIDARHWHVVFSLVAYQLMGQASAWVPAQIALQILMESALPASRLVLQDGGRH